MPVAQTSMEALTLRLGKQISAAQVSPRRGELYRDNLIRKSGERLNDNNRHEDTWSVTE